MSATTKPVISGPLSGEQIASFRARQNAKKSTNGTNGTTASLQRNYDENDAYLDEEDEKRWHWNQSISMQTKAKGSIPNTPLVASAISAALGALLGASLFAAATPLLRLIGLTEASWARPQLGLYLAAMGLFHLLEFWTTAGWNINKLSVDSFLLNNGAQYHYAHAFGLAEYFVSSYFWPSKFDTPFASTPALIAFASLVLVGQVFRSLAMVHAGHSFSHIVKRVKLDDHVLITTGVYGWVRHPSYVGFFYWAVGTQLLLSNAVSTLAFVVILGKFFGARIKDEEVHLMRFFGDKYVQYGKKVGSGLPFVTK